LLARGHDVVLATCPIYRDIVAAEGLRFHPTRPDVDPNDTALLTRVMDPARGTEASSKRCSSRRCATPTPICRRRPTAPI
jgi:hypothetical protein